MKDDSFDEGIEIFRVEISTRMRMVRQARDLSQAEAGEICGVSMRTYREYESGRRTIPTEVVFLFCKGLKVSSDEILFGRKVMSPGQDRSGLFEEISEGLLAVFGAQRDAETQQKQIKLARYAFDNARAKGTGFAEELEAVTQLMG